MKLNKLIEETIKKFTEDEAEEENERRVWADNNYQGRINGS